MKNKRTILSGVLCAIALAISSTAYATDLNFGDSRDIGDIINVPEPANPVDEQHYISQLIALAPGGTSSDTFDGKNHTYERSSNVFGSLPVPVFASKDESGGNTIDLGTGGFQYVLGKYDGPNGGDEVWYIGGLTGIITIPQNGLPKDDNKYGLSHFSLWNPGTSTPDGGTTAALLGLGLSGLAAFRAKFGRN